MAALLAGCGLAFLLVHEASCDSDNQTCLICQLSHSLAASVVPLIAVLMYVSALFRLFICSFTFEPTLLWAVSAIRAPPMQYGC
jgi:hypothetical protein